MRKCGSQHCEHVRIIEPYDVRYEGKTCGGKQYEAANTEEMEREKTLTEYPVF